MKTKIKVPPLLLVTQAKGITRFYVSKDEANVEDEVYLPRTRQHGIYMAVLSTKRY
jgi:hypothetical protein